MDDGSDHKKAKGTKKGVIKQKRMFQNHEDCLFHNKTVQETFRSYYHDVHTEEVNKTALKLRCGKTNVLLNLIENQPDINKIYFYTKDPHEANINV